MSVTVNDNHGKKATYEKGTSIKVTEGHLFVVRQRGTSTIAVAAYAPEKWIKAEVEIDD